MNNSMYRALVAILKIVTIGVVGSSCSHDSEMAPTGGVAVPIAAHVRRGAGSG